VKIAAVLLVLTCFSLVAAQGTPAESSAKTVNAGAQPLQRKLDRIQQNGARPRPDPTPTVLTEDEVNAYLASGAVKLPTGVQQVRLQGTPGIINGTARVDFDKITEGRRSANPLLGLFNGVHDVAATAHASGSGGQAEVHIDTVSLDGMEIPRMALEYFVNHYVKPKYGVGLDSKFTMPSRIDTATVAEHQLTLVQK
jgi:hypothetical protein